MSARAGLLLIDDDEELRLPMAAFFRSHGYRVDSAGEAEEAVAMVRHHRFNVVILDLELNSVEGLDGFSVLKALRQSCPATRAIIHSGYYDQQTVEAVLRHGGSEFIAKPASLSRLLEIVQNQYQLCC